MGISLKNYLRPSVTNIVVTIGVAIVLWLKELLIPSLPHVLNQTAIGELSDATSIWLSLFATLATGYLLFLLTEKFNFIQNRTYLPFFLYVIFSSTLPGFWIFSNGKIGFLLLLLSIWEILSTYHKTDPTKLVFNASMLLSLSILIVPEYIILVLFLFISVFTINTLSSRIVHAIILGLATPVILLGGIYYATGSLQENAMQFVQGLTFRLPAWGNDNVYIIYHIVLFLLSLVAIRGCLMNRYQSNISERKNIHVMIWLFAFLSIIITLRMGQSSETSAAFTGIIAFLFAIFFSSNTSSKNTIFYFVLVMIFIIYNIIMSYGRIG